MADCLVLGAGMIGVTTAVALQERGHDVVLIDRRAPGQETSFGNAGIIQSEAVEPYAMPLQPRALARMALGRSAEVRWSLRGLAGQAGGLARYAWQSRPSAYRRLGAIYAPLVRGATSAHASLIDAAGAGDLVRRDGWIELYRDADALDQAQTNAQRLNATYGIGVRALDTSDLARLEPALRQRLAGGVLWPESWTCTDPGELVAAYARLFEGRGGMILQADAMDLARAGKSWKAAGQTAEIAVIALGPWSPALTARFGLHVPMVLKRGYHRHYQIRTPPQRPMLDAANAVVLSPMRTGLRIATAADLRPAPDLNPPQLARGARAARALFDLGDPVEAAPWSGQRPCMPDMLPVAGPVPGQAGLWAHFGHGHQGFTLGPVTAPLLADQIDGAPGIDALQPARLIRP